MTHLLGENVGMGMQPGYKGRVRKYGHLLITTRGKEMEP